MCDLSQACEAHGIDSRKYQPIAHAMPSGRVAVYIGAAYQHLTLGKAINLRDQLTRSIESVLDKCEPRHAGVVPPMPEPAAYERAHRISVELLDKKNGSATVAGIEFALDTHRDDPNRFTSTLTLLLRTRQVVRHAGGGINGQKYFHELKLTREQLHALALMADQDVAQTALACGRTDSWPHCVTHPAQEAQS